MLRIDAGARKPATRLFLAGLGLLGVVTIQLFRLWDTLPTVLQDEYVYSTGSKYGGMESAAEYGNFLYFWIYQNTALCGPEFYSCARAINGFWFFLLLVVIFAYSSHFFKLHWAFVIAAGVGIGPMGLYVPLYMPEMMYFSLSSMALLFYFRYLGSETWAWKSLSMSFAALALAAMAKPHATFLAIGLLIHLVVTNSVRRDVTFKIVWRDLGTSVIMFLATKFLVGYLLAGAAGITLFGRNYTLTLVDFVRDLFGTRDSVSSGTGGFETGAASQSESLFSVLDVFGLHFLLVVVITVSVSSPLLIFALFGGRYNLRSELIVVLWLMVFLGLIVSFFAAHITAHGDDHSNRLLFRYFEFLLPFLLISSLSAALESQIRGWRAFVSLGLSVVFLVLLFTGLSERQWGIVDSVHLYSLFQPTDSVWIWTAGSFLILYLLMTRLNWQKQGAVMTLSLTLALVGQLGVSHQIALNSTKVPSDYAGEYVYQNFRDVNGNQILVLGSDRKLVEATMFAIDKPNITFLLAPSGSKVTSAAIDEGIEIVVQTLGVSLEDIPKETIVGDGFAISILR